MDVYMPGRNGYEATREIMERVPTPIVMMTASLGGEEASMTFAALKAGALAMVEKPGGPSHPEHARSVGQLLTTVKLMAQVKVVRRWPRRDRPASAPLPSTHSGRWVRIIAIGASTGGPAALAEILRELPGDLSVPIAVVQHITPGFIEGMAEWLGHETRLTVKVAEAGEGVSPGRVYLAPTGRQMGLTHTGRISLKQESGDDGFCPSASYLFRSVAEVYGASAIGILLTGMGRDGAVGLRHLQEAGGVTIAQDEESSVVFGMPGEAVRLGAAAHVLPPRRIARTICAMVPCG
jgi:two-component system chemotaxis response regulator CheB